MGDDAAAYKRTFDLKTKDDPKAWAALVALCKTLNASAGEGAWTANMKCPATDSVGGCQTNTGVGLQTNWFYAPKTVDEVKAECQSDGTTYVTQ